MPFNGGERNSRRSPKKEEEDDASATRTDVVSCEDNNRNKHNEKDTPIKWEMMAKQKRGQPKEKRVISFYDAPLLADDRIIRSVLVRPRPAKNINFFKKSFFF